MGVACPGVHKGFQSDVGQVTLLPQLEEGVYNVGCVHTAMLKSDIYVTQI